VKSRTQPPGSRQPPTQVAMHGKCIVSFANTSKGGEKPLVSTAPCQHSKLSKRPPHLRSGWFKRQWAAFAPSVLSITQVAPRGGVQLDLGISACIAGWHFPAFYRVSSDQLSTHRGHDSLCNPCRWPNKRSPLTFLSELLKSQWL